MPDESPKGAYLGLFRVFNAFFANTVVRWDQLCAAILWRNGRVGFSFRSTPLAKTLELYNSTLEAYRGCMGPIVGIQLGEDVFDPALYRFFGD